MYLSKLAYEVVKATLKLGNSEFNYEAFRVGDFDNDIDYSSDIDNAFTEINQAIHRLSDLRKIPYKVEPITINGNFFDYKNLNLKVKSVTAIVKINSNGSYTNYSYRVLSPYKLSVMGVSSYPQNLFIEYIEDIPNFSIQDYEYDQNGQMVRDVDLMDYGINETMCSKIILYASGRLFQHIDPSMSAREQNVAEQYFNDLESHGTSFDQNHIVATNIMQEF